MSEPPQERSRSLNPVEEVSVSRLPLLSLIFLRFAMLAVLPFEALVSYGDYRHFFDLARLSVEGGGLPFVGHWVEFPPLFPYLSIGLERLAGGQFHVYVYLLAVLMMLLDLGNLWIFSRLVGRASDQKRAESLVWIYAVFLAVPAFGWWTFDPLAVFFMLLSIWLILERRYVGAGLTVAFGFLTKIFPVIALIIAWRFRPRRSAILVTSIALAISLAILGGLFAASPSMARASLSSQLSKGSWETVWALIDGNSGTGVFGPVEERLDPEFALQTRANPARVPLWLTTVVAGLLAAWVFIKTNPGNEANAFPFVTMLWGILLLWSRGWSPQWVAYLVPLLLLTFPIGRSLCYALSLIMVALLEWPILLSRGRFDLLWLPVVIRFLLIVLFTMDSGTKAMRGSLEAHRRRGA